MDILHNSDSSPYINEVDVVPPSPPAGQREIDFNQSPYLQDNNHDFGLGNSLGSPSFNGSYYSPYSNHSELSFSGEHDINYNIFDDERSIGLGLRTEYDPSDFDGPQQTSSLLIYQDNEFMPQFSTLSASKSDPRNNNAPYDHSSPSSNASGNDDHPIDKRSRASSVSSNHANNFHASPRLDVAQSFEAMTFHSPNFNSRPLSPVSRSPVPPTKALSPPRLMMPDDQLGDQQGPPGISEPVGKVSGGGPSFNIVPATPVGGGASVANAAPFQGTLETLHQGSALRLQSQQWSSVDQQSTTATGQSSNSAPKQEFTFPSQSRDTIASTANGSPHMGQAVDDNAAGDPNFLFISPRTRSKSDTSREHPAWDQSYLEQQRQLGALGGTAVVDEQTVNMNDVLPGTQQSQLNPEFTFGNRTPNNFLSPGLDPIRRVRSDGSKPLHRQSRSEDIRGTHVGPQSTHQHSQSSGQFLFPPLPTQMTFLSPNQQPFYGGSSGSPDGPLPSISSNRSSSPVGPLTSRPGHIRRASSGTRSERGAEAWSGAPLPQHRLSPYPSPHASPRPRAHDLPFTDDYNTSLLGVDSFGFPQQQHAYNSGYISGTYTPSSTGASAYHTPGQSPSPAPPLTIEPSVPKPTVTTGRTANASHKRRKQEASFICPIPGCGSTFTRSFNLKGHIRSHKEEKPFVCHWPGCGKGFARQHDCKRHEQLHTNFRPFSCAGCGKHFARMDALNRHLRSEGGAECQKQQELDGEAGRSDKMEVASGGFIPKTAALAL